ncbi:TadA family conjugal transfer-associated ATPase [Pseudoclavibacter chungangensis]|uniref:TadA family conjugal transfer-associated ATPase n=1 Tax=Pseudoclavibacter chungangensis TaxID=587635 RepID=A0A7J5BZ29_9MICO|nr:TadA family conjugal transfer-associated ATPase [Pseudoclavibacter chungangensis]KAB1659394.1 TadA family conjugal transfer-associated ATPase [Pseudoclavibacter chungangensis]NYJ67767.1 pilus assembly protein CpaF [Pseudoclavibacter chungangensis]
MIPNRADADIVPYVPRRPGERVVHLALPEREPGTRVRGERPVRPLTRALASAFGPLAPYVADGDVTDLFVNGPDALLVDRGAGPVRARHWRVADEAALRALAVSIVAAGGRHVDESSPCVDVRLGAGFRVHVVLPPVSTSGTLVSVRLPRAESLDLRALAARGMFPPGIEARLRDAVDRRENVLVTGAAGAGKTALLGALMEAAAPSERIVTIEDVAELRPRHPHVVALEARQANIEGAGAVALERLVREALRMRPDRLVLGECRGAEVRELLSALNTGHDGGAGTLHANSLADVPARLEALGALAGLEPPALARQAAAAIDLVVHVERVATRRRVAAIGRFSVGGDGRLVVREVDAVPGKTLVGDGQGTKGRDTKERGTKKGNGVPGADGLRSPAAPQEAGQVESGPASTPGTGTCHGAQRESPAGARDERGRRAAGG